MAFESLFSSTFVSHAHSSIPYTATYTQTTHFSTIHYFHAYASCFRCIARMLSVCNALTVSFMFFFQEKNSPHFRYTIANSCRDFNFMYRSENSSINRFASLTSNHENHKKHVLNEINCSLITHARILYTRLCECFVLTLLALSNLFGNGNGSMFVTFCFIVRWYVCDSSIMH